MVCKINALVYDDLALLKEMASRDSYKSCSPLIDAINGRYEEYAKKKGSPLSLHVDADFAQHKKSLHSIYNSKAELVVTLKDSVKGITQGYCPLCGLPSEPSTVDHYLPKEQYPEFSVYSLNLVPSCARCNSGKNDSLLRDGLPASLNVYFDDICSSKILSLNLTPPYEKFKAKLTPDSSLTGELLKLVDNHLKQFKLDARYRCYFPRHYFSLWGRISSVSAKVGHPIAFELFSDEFNKVTKSFGPNYFESLLLDAVLNSPAFKYMCENPAPE